MSTNSGRYCQSQNDHKFFGEIATTNEQSEIDPISPQDLDILNEILNSALLHNLFIKAGPYTFPEGQAGLLRKFGNDVNLASVTASRALRRQGFR